MNLKISGQLAEMITKCIYRVQTFFGYDNKSVIAMYCTNTINKIIADYIIEYDEDKV